MNHVPLVAVAVFLVLIQKSAFYTTSRCPHEAKDDKVQGYGFGIPQRCMSLIDVESILNPAKKSYETVVESCNELFKKGTIGFAGDHFKEGSFWQFRRGRHSVLKILNGWRWTSVKWGKFGPCANDSIGCWSIEIGLKVGDKLRKYNLRLHHSTYEISSTIDLHLGYVEYMKLIAANMPRNLCAYLVRDEQTKEFIDSNMFDCSSWPFGYYMCESDPYEDCSYQTIESCVYDRKTKQCFTRRNIRVVHPAEMPYGRCPNSSTDYYSPCLCPTCSRTQWSAWTTPNATCGQVLSVRYRPRNGMKEDACQDVKQKRLCCSETRTLNLPKCAEEKSRIIVTLILFIAIALVTLSVCTFASCMFILRRKTVVRRRSTLADFQQEAMRSLKALKDQFFKFGKAPKTKEEVAVEISLHQEKESPGRRARPEKSSPTKKERVPMPVQTRTAVKTKPKKQPQKQPKPKFKVSRSR